CVPRLHRALDLRPGPRDQHGREHVLAPPEGGAVALRLQDAAPAAVAGDPPRCRGRRPGAVLQGDFGGAGTTGPATGAARGGLQGITLSRESPMTAEEAVERLNVILAHAWMVRTFLKHSEEIQDDEEMLEVHRTLFDAIRAVEPSYQRRDFKEYLRRLKGKLPKVKRVAEFFARE